jgi:hypothetical protein
MLRSSRISNGALLSYTGVGFGYGNHLLIKSLVQYSGEVGRGTGVAGVAERGFSCVESTLRSSLALGRCWEWTGGAGCGFSGAGECFWGGEMFVWCSGG